METRTRRSAPWPKGTRTQTYMFKYIQVVDDMHFPLASLEDAIDAEFVITERKPTTIVFQTHQSRAPVAQFVDEIVPQDFRLYLKKNTFAVKARVNRPPHRSGTAGPRPPAFPPPPAAAHSASAKRRRWPRAKAKLSARSGMRAPMAESPVPDRRREGHQTRARTPSPDPPESPPTKRTWISKRSDATPALLKAAPKPLAARSSEPASSSTGPVPSLAPELFRTRQMVGFLRNVADLIDPDVRPSEAPEMKIQMLI